MKSRLGWIAGGLLAFIICLLVYLPASQVVGRLTLPNTVRISGVSGTIWNGQAQMAMINGLPMKNLEWQIHPLSLLWGTLSADIKAGNLRDANDIAFEGPVAVNVFSLHPIESSGFLLFLPANRVLAQVPLPLPVDAGGRFRVRLDMLAFGPKCDELHGFGDWLNATVAGTKGPIDFGNYTAELSCKGEDIGIEVKEPNLLGLSMTATVSPDFKSIKVGGQFKPDPSLPAEVSQAARMFAQPDPDGYTRFSIPRR